MEISDGAAICRIDYWQFNGVGPESTNLEPREEAAREQAKRKMQQHYRTKHNVSTRTRNPNLPITHHTLKKGTMNVKQGRSTLHLTEGQAGILTMSSLVERMTFIMLTETSRFVPIWLHKAVLDEHHHHGSGDGVLQKVLELIDIVSDTSRCVVPAE